MAVIDFLKNGNVYVYPITLTTAVYKLDGTILDTWMNSHTHSQYSLISHNHDSVYSKLNHGHSNMNTSGRAAAITGSGRIPTPGLSLVEVYNNGYPTSYGNLLRVSCNGESELLLGWSGQDGNRASMYYRNHRDSGTPPWSSWYEILDSGNYSSFAAPKSHTHPKSQITDFPSSLPANGGNSDTVDGCHASDLVLSKTVLGAGYDMNNALKSGFYRLTNNHVNSAGPDWSQMIVCAAGGDTISQIVVSYADSIIKFRSGNPPSLGGSGSWRPWAEVIDRNRFNPAKISSSAPPTDALWAW